MRGRNGTACCGICGKEGANPTLCGRCYAIVYDFLEGFDYNERHVFSAIQYIQNRVDERQDLRSSR